MPPTSSAASASAQGAANASIWPIQLCDRHPGGLSNPITATTAARKRLSYVPIQRLDFEDVSYFLDFDVLGGLLRQPQRSNTSHASSSDQGFEVGTKRKHLSMDPEDGLAPPDPKKRIKNEASDSRSDDSTDLIDTCVLFRIKAQEAHDTDIVLELKQLIQDLSPSERPQIKDLKFDVVGSSQRPEDSIISHTIRLCDHTTGRRLVELPILATESLSVQDPDRGKETNGEWLFSLSNLLAKGAVAASFALEPASPPSDYPTDRVTADSLFLKLSIKVQVPVSNVAAGFLARDRMLDMARLVRFAGPAFALKEEKVDTSFVYQNLRPATLAVSDAIQPADLGPTLLPFQKRSTAFVLGREGKRLDDNGSVIPSEQIMAHDGYRDLGLWWEQLGPDLYYNWIEARFVRDRKLTMLSDFKGAMLAEEMGLGKTMEAVALMLLNPDPDASCRAGWYDERNQIDVVPTKTTLIVAPETLRAQWIEEIAAHAPGLAVYSYRGRTKAEKDVPPGLTWEQWAPRFDVMILSYAVLSRELDSAKTAPDRSRRRERKYERPRSPLVRLHFHRVLMDEVQMIGASNAAETVSMISRGSSIAVSGTPVKKMDDLKSCFRFLRIPGYLATPSEWNAILHPLLSPALVRVLRTIGTRHTKAQVASEMSLPMQTRAVIPIDFTSIEAAFYADVWKDALADTAYTQEGEPSSPNHEIDIAKMRQHLLLLRQACTHPQVALQFRGGVVGTKNLRSIDEVLELMIDSTRTELHTSRTYWFDRRIHRNILVLYRRDEDARILAASQLSDIEEEINKAVLGFEQEIRDAGTFGPLYRFTEHELELEQRAEARTRRLDMSNSDEKQDENGELALEAVVGDAEAYLVLLEKRKARAVHVVQLKAQLRTLLMKLHRLLQFVGNLYYQRGEFLDEQGRAAQARGLDAQASAEATDRNAKIKVEAEEQAEASFTTSTAPSALDAASSPAAIHKSPSEIVADIKPIVSPERQILKDREDAAYAKAEKVRQRLLMEAGDKVSAAVTKLNRAQVQMDAGSIRASKALFELGGGIFSNDAYQSLATDVDLLNDHADVLFRWRQSIITRLVRAVNRDVSLEREDDDQYQENLDTQAEAEVLLEMYRPLLAEREKILKGGVAIGATERPQLFKELEAAVRIARQNDLRGIAPETEADVELVRVQQQQLAHFKKLDEERRAVSLSDPSQSVLNVADELKGLRDTSFGEEEAALVKQGYIEARRLLSEQSKHLDKLKNEEKLLLTSLFNARSQYFKEIQVLSDTVRDPIFMDLERTIQATQKEEIEMVSKVDELERRLRYLLHLQMVQSTDQLDDEAKTCNICTDPIEIGILTHKCGHVCCESCWKEWQSQGHRTCVLCQTRVLPNEVHRIIYSRAKTSVQDGQVAATAENSTGSATASTGSGKQSPLALRYNELNDTLRSTLNGLATQGRFGSKIDHVTKHVRHIINRTGEKSLIFSSFGRGLDVVAQSLTANGIRYVRLTGAGKSGSEAAKIFRSDPTIHVMLLHSEAQSSGLNLLAASHIHILEPLLNTSLELQAIGRVHRIGQTKQTNIWCYFVKDTVEERILALQAYKGQSLYLKGRHTSLSDGPNALETSTGSSSSSNRAAAEHSRQDAKKWSAFGKSQTGGAKGAMRGDVTSNSTELLSCFFARYLPLLGQMPSGSLQSAVEAVAGGGSSDINADVEQTDRVASGSGSAVEAERDELSQLRRARLAALEQRQSHHVD